MDETSPRHGADTTGGTVRVRTDHGDLVLRCDQTDPSAPRLSLDDPGPTFGLSFHTRRCISPVSGVRVEIMRSGLFGEAFPAGAVLLPDDGRAPVWLISPERSDAGRILIGASEALRAERLPLQLSLPPALAPRARVEQIARWDRITAPNSLAGGLPPGDCPTDIHQALGGSWTVVLDAAPRIPLEARLWLARHEQESGSDVVRLTATWHGPGADVPWHVELHVAHRADEGETSFLAIDGSTEDPWTLADAVQAPGIPLTWRVHPAPQPDETSRTGEALYALITALAHACPR